jgi:hypothetical protein
MKPERLNDAQVSKKGNQDMLLSTIAKDIYVPNTASEDTQFRIVTHINNQEIWKGPAKDMAKRVGKTSWIVVEIKIDPEDTRDNIPDYNKNKIITII